MASNKDYVVREAQKAAQTYKPAPVYKPTTPSVLKEAGTAAYNTAKKGK